MDPMVIGWPHVIAAAIGGSFFPRAYAALVGSQKSAIATYQGLLAEQSRLDGLRLSAVEFKYEALVKHAAACDAETKEQGKALARYEVQQKYTDAELIRLSEELKKRSVT